MAEQNKAMPTGSKNTTNTNQTSSVKIMNKAPLPKLTQKRKCVTSATAPTTNKRQYGKSKKSISVDGNGTVSSNIENTRINCRTSLNKLNYASKRLNLAQKKAVADMGFLAITKIEFDKLDRNMIQWLLQLYDPNKCLLVFDNIWHVEFSDEEIGRSLGIPYTGNIIDINFESKVGIDKYNKYFKISSGRIDLDDLGRRLERCTSHGEEFKVCYLAYVFGTLLFPDSQINLRAGFLNALLDLDNVHLMNWAKYVKETLNNLLLDNRKSLSGCVFLFQVIFYARAVPKNTNPCVNLSSTLSYIEQLPKEKIAMLKLQFNNAGGYMNPNARAENMCDGEKARYDNVVENPILKSGKGEAEHYGISKSQNIIDNKVNMMTNMDEVHSDSGAHENNADKYREASPAMYYQDNMQNLSSTDDESGNYEQEYYGGRPNMKNYKPKDPITLEPRVEKLETILYQVYDLLNSNRFGQTTVHAREDKVLNDKLLRRQIKLLEEIKQCLTEFPKTIKLAMRELVSGVNLGEHKPDTKKMNDTIVLDGDDDLPKIDEVIPCSPVAETEAIVEFLFVKEIPKSVTVVDYGNYSLTIGDIHTLRPECYIRDSVIDAVAYMCTEDQRIKTNSAPDWFFPASMTRYMLDGKTDDDKLLDYYFRGNYKFTNDIESLQRVYLPIHDQIDHWFLACINYHINTVEIWDSCRSNSKMEHRKTLVMKAVKRFDVLMCKLEGQNYISRVPSFRKRKQVAEFRYDDMNAHQQINGSDCGLHVCSIMKFDEGLERIDSKKQSENLRQELAVGMYKHFKNKFAWKD